MIGRGWRLLVSLLGLVGGLHASEGPYVVLLNPQSSFARAGVCRFDRLVAVDDQPLDVWTGGERLAGLPAGPHTLRVV